MTADQFTRDEFARQVGSTARVRDPAGVELTLAEVSVAQVSGSWESFSMLLRGPAGVPLEQRIYELDHDELGALELFLVPVAPDELGPRYEVVFNRAAAAAHTGGA